MESISNEKQLITSLGEEVDRIESEQLKQLREEKRELLEDYKAQILSSYQDAMSNAGNRKGLIKFLVKGRFSPICFTDEERAGFEKELLQVLGQ